MRMRYVLVTPVKNEQQLIGQTINSVVKQTVLPVEWVIVSDGSTDQTDEIVESASVNHPWIRLIKLPAREHRSFASVVFATQRGVQAIQTKDFDFIGLLDSDVRFQQDYFERLMGEFVSPNLGLAGGVVIDLGQPRDRIPLNRQDVPGAVQFFRKECFQSLSGLIPVPEGGWDGLTCAEARMRGYETRLVADLVVDHLKPRNSSEGGTIRRKWQMGHRDYAVGYHPVFVILKCLSRMLQPPLVIGSMAWWSGFCWAAVQRKQRVVQPELVSFLRQEQKRRVRGLLTRRQ